MSTRTGKKRSAMSGTNSASKGPATKKTRFAEPSDDAAAFAEEVESALEDPLARRKGRVKTDGYESDSTDDGEGVVLSRRKENADEDDDMFAIGEKEQKGEERTGKKKTTYLRLGDIEGQEFGDRAGSESSDEDEPEDEDDAERRKKAGMGFELSSFNMREEMEEGKFDADGTYVRSVDPHGVHDRWMEGLDEKDIKLARRRKKAHDRQQMERIKAEERELEESGGKAASEQALLALLKKGETVLEALQRLGRAKAHKAYKRNAKDNVATIAGALVNADHASADKSDIDHITQLASNLMALGDVDIYSKTYEELVRSVRSSGKVDPSWSPPSADVKYEYRWDVPGAGDADQIFGPYSEDEMRTWFKLSYFGSNGEKIKIREVGSQWCDWADLMTWIVQ